MANNNPNDYNRNSVNVPPVAPPPPPQGYGPGGYNQGMDPQMAAYMAKMEQDRKKNQTIIIAAAVVGAIAIAVGGFFGYNKFFKDKVNTVPPKGNTISQQAPSNPAPSVATSVARSYSPIYMGGIARAYESSADRENNYVHSAQLTIDRNISSCWAEGAPGLGLGEYVMYEFVDTFRVSGINIWPGHQKSTSLYYKNARPSVIKVEGSDGYAQTWRLNDTMAKHTLHFNAPINTRFIKITVQDAYPGNTWQDTCIAEVEFY